MKKQEEYLTVLGDTWDLISYKVYGTEYNLIDLMKANPEHLRTVVFSAGVRIICPDIEDDVSNLPPWKRGD